MTRQESDRVKGAAMGIAVGAAVGAMGSYLAQQHPREVKRAVKKMTHTAQRAVNELDRALTSR